MKTNLVSKLIFAVLLAFTVNIFTYFSVSNVYSSILLNIDTFKLQYHNGIYQYRILSNYLLEWIYTFITSFPYEVKMKAYLWDKTADPQMLLSFAILNTFFAVLSAIVMVLIMETKNFVSTTSAEKILITSVALFAIAITQFVIVPYDCSSYFFILLFFWIFLKYLGNNNPKTLAYLVLIIVISSLNRESSALSISLAATFLFSKYGITKKTILPIFWMVAAYIAVYIGIRIYFGKFTTNDGNLLLLNFTLIRNLFGILFWAVFFSLTLFIAKDKTAVRNILIFHLLSLPYILMCFYTGALYEIRLYIPLFLTSLLIARTEFSKID